MSARPNRRAMLMAGAGLGALLLGAGGYEAWRHFGKRYPRTPYDDLFALIPDREAMEKLSKAVRRHGDVYIDPRSTAQAIRSEVANRPFVDVLGRDIRDDRMTEVGGWVLPTTMVEILWLRQQT
jgi:hypothetical protein